MSHTPATEHAATLPAPVGLALPARLDSAAAGPLAADLRRHIGRPLTLDASACAVIGGLCLQVLLAAARQWQSDGTALSITRPSEGFLRSLNTLGIAPQVLSAPGRTGP